MANEAVLRPTVATAEFLKRGCVTPIDIELRNITYTVMHGAKRKTKTILKGVSGKFERGTLTAILGPSGAGKSSLMNVIAGYRAQNVEGDVLLNRRRRDMDAFRKLACYIMQEDRLIDELTAYESLVYSAHLKLARSAVSESERISLINEIIELMGLGQCAHTRVAKLSGGQRKRLSIALELVQNTPILLLDEPTTGLDSVSCYQCVSMLQKLARGGRTVICTIHQPSAKIFELFDELYFVVDGQCVYDGPVRSLVAYLRRHDLSCPPYHNPADYMMEIAVGLHGAAPLDRLKVAIRERDLRLQAAFAHARLSVRNRLGVAAKSEKPTNERQRTSVWTRVITQLHAFGLMLIGERMNSELAAVQNRKEDGSNFCSPTEGDESNESDVPVYGNDAAIVECHPPVTCRSGQLSTIVEVSEIALDTRPLTLARTAGCASDQSDGKQRLQVLLHRTGVCLWRDGMLNHVRWISAAVFGFLVGLLFYNTANDGHRVSDIGSCLLFHAMFIIYVTLMISILRLPLETLLVIKEHLNGWYDVHTYFWSRMIVDMPLQFAVPVIYASIVYFMMGLPLQLTRFSMFVCVMLVSTLCASSFAYMLSAMCTVQTALFVAPMFSTPQLLFSGYFLPLDAIPAFLKWLSYTSFIRFSFSATLLSLYGPISGVPSPKLNCDPAQSRQCFEDPNSIIELFGMQHSNYLVDCLVLLAYSVLFRLVCYFILRHRVKTR